MAAQWSVEFFVEANGSEPVADFITSLESKMQAKVVWSIDLLEEFGTALSMPHSRPVVGHDFRELRTIQSGNIVRIFYFAVSGKRMVLLHGFAKRSQKTPAGELTIAQKRLIALREREKQERS